MLERDLELERLVSEKLLKNARGIDIAAFLRQEGYSLDEVVAVLKDYEFVTHQQMFTTEIKQLHVSDRGGILRTDKTQPQNHPYVIWWDLPEDKQPISITAFYAACERMESGEERSYVLKDYPDAQLLNRIGLRLRQHKGMQYKFTHVHGRRIDVACSYLANY